MSSLSSRRVIGEAEKARELSSRLIRNIANTKPAKSKLRTCVEIDLGGPVWFGAYGYITGSLHPLGT